MLRVPKCVAKDVSAAGYCVRPDARVLQGEGQVAQAMSSVNLIVGGAKCSAPLGTQPGVDRDSRARVQCTLCSSSAKAVANVDGAQVVVNQKQRPVRAQVSTATGTGSRPLRNSL